MSKHLKDLLICLLSITILVLGCVGLYYGYKEHLRKTRRTIWQNDFETQLYRNVKNPYYVKEKIYHFYAPIHKNQRRTGNYCVVEIYSLNKNPNSNNLQEYLNYYDDTLDDSKIIISNPNKNMVTLLSKDNNIVTHSWIYNNQVSSDLFNGNIFYDKYLTCLSIIKHTPSHDHGYIFQKTKHIITYQQHFKYPTTNAEILNKKVLSILENPDTLVKVRNISTVYFYDVNQEILIILKFQKKSESKLFIN